MPEHRPISLVIVTGFLGAGKTTLLNHILKDPALSDTAVVINEFGEVAIDHLLVEQAGDGVIELGGGCLCCTVRGALVDTLLSLLDRPLRRVVVETTGLADPVPLLQSVMAHPVLAEAYRVDCVLTVVDVVNGSNTLEAFDEARNQVAVADRIVLTKSDIADARTREALLARLAALNGDAELLDSRRPESIRADMLLEPALDIRTVPAGHDHHDHDHHHDHAGHHHHHEEFGSVSLLHDRPIPFTAIEGFLHLLASQQGERILRIKGLVETAEDPDHPLLLQGAQKLLHPPQALPRWPEGERGTRIVVIGRALDADYIRRIFAAFVGVAGVDTPDRTALVENPLSISGLRQ
jgi:G3E family GTPase